VITVISSTNRYGNNSIKVANVYLNLLKEEGQDCVLFSLAELPESVMLQDIYTRPSKQFQSFIDNYIVPSEKIIFIVPEYNYSIPGVLKLFIDVVHPDYFKGKKTAMVGIGAGKSGNVSGLEHLSQIFNHLKMDIFSNKLSIPRIRDVVNEIGIKDESVIIALKSHVLGFIEH